MVSTDAGGSSRAKGEWEREGKVEREREGKGRKKGKREKWQEGQQTASQAGVFDGNWNAPLYFPGFLLAAAPPEGRRPASFSSLGEHMGPGAWRWQLPLWTFPGKFEMGHLQLRAGTQYVFPKCQFSLLSNQGFLHWKDKKLPQSNKSYNL